MEKKYYLFKMTSGTIYIITAILFILAAYVFSLIYGDNAQSIIQNNFGMALSLYLPYLILHEGFHALSYVIHGADYKNITFGGHIEKGVLCCLCKQNVTKKNILISLLYPFFFIGIVTLIIGLVIDCPTLVILSLANISGCSGDLVMFYHLVKIKDYEFSEYNDPIAFGLYTKEDLSTRKMLGLKFVEAKKELQRDDLRKFDISKATIIMCIIYLLFIIINIVDKVIPK